jgi:hypothetical protein
VGQEQPDTIERHRFIVYEKWDGDIHRVFPFTRDTRKATLAEAAYHANENDLQIAEEIELDSVGRIRSVVRCSVGKAEVREAIASYQP